MRSPRTARKSNPHSRQLEKACTKSNEDLVQPKKKAQFVFTRKLTHECLHMCVLVASVVSGSVQHYRLQPARLLCAWDSPGKNTGVGCHALLQGIFPTQGSNPRCLHLLYRRKILYPLSHRVSVMSVSSSCIHKCSQLETTRISTNRWINKLWYSYMIECYSAIKRNELIIQIMDMQHQGLLSKALWWEKASSLKGYITGWLNSWDILE